MGELVYFRHTHELHEMIENGLNHSMALCDSLESIINNNLILEKTDIVKYMHDIANLCSSSLYINCRILEEIESNDS